jgi:hypothetical protein
MSVVLASLYGNMKKRSVKKGFEIFFRTLPEAQQGDFVPMLNQAPHHYHHLRWNFGIHTSGTEL